MKKQITVQQLSKAISGKLGLSFETDDFAALQEFIEEIIPAIDADWKRDVPDFATFWRYYEDDSPQGFITVQMKKDDAAEFLKTLDKNVLRSTIIFDEAYEEYDSVEEVPTEMVNVECYGYYSEFLERMKEFTLASAKRYEVVLMNYYPLYLRYSGSEITWIIENGNIVGGGDLVIPMNNEEELLIRTWWIASEVIGGFDDLSKYGIRLVCEE